MVQVVKGRDVAVTFDAKRCIHSRRCVLGRPDVFAAGAGRDWINPDAAPAEAVPVDAAPLVAEHDVAVVV